MFVRNNSNLNGARLLYTVYGRVLGGGPTTHVLCAGNRAVAGRLVRTVRGNAATRFHTGCHRISILLISSVRFVTNGADARRRFFRAFSTLRSGGGRVILADSQPPQRVTGLRRHLRSHFIVNLLTSVRPPGLRAHVTVVHHGTGDLSLPLRSSMTRCVTGRVGDGIHRLRNIIGQVHTRCVLVNRRPGLVTTRGTVQSVHGSGRPAPIAIRHVVARITHAVGIAPRSVHDGGGSTPVSGTQRITTFTIHGVAGLPVGSVNSRFNNHSRSAVICTVRGIRRRVTRSATCGGVVGSVVHGIDRGTWVESVWTVSTESDSPCCVWCLVCGIVLRIFFSAVFRNNTLSAILSRGGAAIRCLFATFSQECVRASAGEYRCGCKRPPALSPELSAGAPRLFAQL